MRHQNWRCPKCSNSDFETDQFSATGGALSKFFNVQNRKYNTLSCTSCGHTEFYKTESSTIGNILDFFGN